RRQNGRPRHHRSRQPSPLLSLADRPRRPQAMQWSRAATLKYTSSQNLGECPLSGVKRKSELTGGMPANDPKQTFNASKAVICLPYKLGQGPTTCALFEPLAYFSTHPISSMLRPFVH